MLAQQDSPIPSPKDKIFAPGTVLSNLAKGLAGRGHSVKIYAAADSDIKQIPIESNGIRSTHHYEKEMSTSEISYRSTQHTLFQASAAFQEFKEGKYDLLYIDSFPISMYFSNFVSGPILCIHHTISNYDESDKFELDRLRQLRFFDKIKFIAISNKQRELSQKYFNYIATIPHGIDLDAFHFNNEPKNELLYIGRIIPTKGVHIAIEVAKKTGMKLDIFGNYDPNDNYWEKEIVPLLGDNKIKYHGVCPFDKVSEVYSEAKAVLLPISRHEPFGLVMVEAMACGTPVIAYDMGSVPEIIKDGVTGYVVKEGNLEGLVDCVKKINQINRINCRKRVEEYYSLNRMVNDYEKLFSKIIAESK